MKTNEFIKKVEELGYTVYRTESLLSVNFTIPDMISCCLLDLRIKQQYSLHIRPQNFLYGTDNEEERKKLYDLAVEYDKTPIEEREEKKKYYIRLNGAYVYKKCSYLNKQCNNNELWFSNEVDASTVKTKFTDEEISELPTWVTNMLRDGYLIKEEVKDDNEN